MYGYCLLSFVETAADVGLVTCLSLVLKFEVTRSDRFPKCTSFSV